MPQLGETVSEGTVIKWLRRPGDAVAVDQPLLEIQTDKVSMEVAAAFLVDVKATLEKGSVDLGQSQA